MKNSLIGSLIVWMVGVWSAPALASGLHEQVIRLQPGWNAVYLDVQPEIADADRVFRYPGAERMGMGSARAGSAVC